MLASTRQRDTAPDPWEGLSDFSTWVAMALEREARVKLNLARSADGGEYSAGVACEITRNVFENGVSVPSQSERALRVTRDRKIRMIE